MAEQGPIVGQNTFTSENVFELLRCSFREFDGSICPYVLGGRNGFASHERVCESRNYYDGDVGTAIFFVHTSKGAEVLIQI